MPPCVALARAQRSACSSGVRRSRRRGVPWASRATSLRPSAPGATGGLSISSGRCVSWPSLLIAASLSARQRRLGGSCAGFAIT
eukprot:3511090-Alexandrium_andersonii.AAC.1